VQTATLKIIESLGIAGLSLTSLMGETELLGEASFFFEIGLRELGHERDYNGGGKIYSKSTNLCYPVIREVERAISRQALY
jgi:hypothetical protein